MALPIHSDTFAVGYII